MITLQDVSHKPQALTGFQHDMQYGVTLLKNEQATDLIRYSDFCRNFPVKITIL